jgi:hypothetical protein
MKIPEYWGQEFGTFKERGLPYAPNIPINAIIQKYGALAQAGEELSRSGFGLSRTFMQIEQEKQEQGRADETLFLVSQGEGRLTDLEDELLKKANWRTYTSDFETGFESIQEDLLSQATDPIVARHIYRELSRLKIPHYAAAKRKENELFVSSDRANLSQLLDQTSDQIYRTGGDEDIMKRDRLTALGEAAIQIRTGRTLSPDDAEALRQKWLENNDSMLALRDIQRDPTEAIKKLADPAFHYINLKPERREKLSQTAWVRAEHLAKEIIREQDRLEKGWERQIKTAQDTGEVHVSNRIYDMQRLAQDQTYKPRIPIGDIYMDIVDWSMQGLLRPDQQHRLMALYEKAQKDIKEGDVPEDPQEKARIMLESHDPRTRLSFAEIDASVTSGEINWKTGTTAKTALRTISEGRKDERRSELQRRHSEAKSTAERLLTTRGIMEKLDPMSERFKANFTEEFARKSSAFYASDKPENDPFLVMSRIIRPYLKALADYQGTQARTLLVGLPYRTPEELERDRKKLTHLAYEQYKRRLEEYLDAYAREIQLRQSMEAYPHEEK